MQKGDFQVLLSAKVNLISDKAGQEGSVNYEFGVNQIPTKAHMDKVIRECIAVFNAQLNVDDARLVTMGDFGFAATKGMNWEFEDEQETDGD